jgi:hypothetical protein
VAEGIVDDLETVQIQEHHGEFLTATFGVGDRKLETVLEKGPVWQARQQVVIGLEIDECFGFLSLGDITGGAVIARAIAISAALGGS